MHNMAEKMRWEFTYRVPFGEERTWICDVCGKRFVFEKTVFVVDEREILRRHNYEHPDSKTFSFTQEREE